MKISGCFNIVLGTLLEHVYILIDINLPPHIIRLILDSYSHQTLKTRWGQSLSHGIDLCQKWGETGRCSLSNFICPIYG